MIGFTYHTLFSSLYMAASGSATSVPVSLVGAAGYLSVYLASNYAGTSGTLSLIYELSNDGVSYSQVTTLSSLITGFTKTSGPAADGKTFLYFNPPIAAWVRLKVTETAAANPIQVTAVLGVL